MENRMIDDDAFDISSGEDTVPGDVVGKMDKLYYEAQAIKMTNLGAYLKASRSDSAQEGNVLKLSQMALKAIELQLKILGNRARDENNERLPESVEIIWEAMMEVPALRGLLARESIRERILDNLKGHGEEAEP